MYFQADFFGLFTDHSGPVLTGEGGGVGQVALGPPHPCEQNHRHE